MKENIPTTIITLPSGKEFVIYNYLTGGENRQLQKILLGSATINPNTKEISNIPGSVIFDSQELALSFLIKDFNKTEVDNLSQDDSDFLYSKVDEITKNSKLENESKKKS